jgi:hypothetical protein
VYAFDLFFFNVYFEIRFLLHTRTIIEPVKKTYKK